MKFKEILNRLEEEAFKTSSIASSKYLAATLKKLKEKMDLNDYMLFKKGFFKTLIDYGNSIIAVIRRTMGFAGKGLSKKDIEKIISKSWSGKSYSDRVWKHMDALKQRVEKTVYDVVMGTIDQEQAIKLITESFGVSESSARRLIRTETAYALNQKDMYLAIAQGYTKYRYTAQMDERTSAVCRELNGKVFTFDEAQIGINFPPVHPNCRSTITPIK